MSANRTDLNDRNWRIHCRSESTIAEVAFVTASLRAGAALGPGLVILKLAEQRGKSDRAPPPE